MSKIILINTGKTQYTEGSLNWLTDGTNMFNACYNLTSFDGDLSSLTTGYWMFYSCSNLTSFSSNLSSLTNGDSMFQNCKKLTSFNGGDLSSLTNGSNMFNSCENFTSFSYALPNLMTGYNMFHYCSVLTSFNSDLSSLTDGRNMFGSGTYNCTKLDLASVQNIAATINDLASQGKTGTIHIGMQKALQSDDETAPINVALATIRAKGWTVTEIYKS